MVSIKRDIQSKLAEWLVPGRAVLIYGPRRVGKTVLMKEVVRGWRGKTLAYNGEDAETSLLLADRSIANYRRLLDGVKLFAIDEAQHVPDIGMIIKLIVDEVPGVTVLATGSSSFDLLNRVGEPLVGRAMSFMLHPFSYGELAAVESPTEIQQNLEMRLIYGSYPEAVLGKSVEWRVNYLRNVVEAYLLKDILSIDGLRGSAKMMDLLRLVAYQVGSVVVCEELGRQLGMSRVTVEKYLDLLEKCFIIYRLGSYSRNLRKEVTKAGKWYFVDNGIRNAVIGDFRPLVLRRDVGALWENYMMGERRKLNSNRRQYKRPYFWRTYDGQEVDLVEEEAGALAAMEFKWGERIPPAPRAFRTAYPDATFHVVNPGNYRGFV